MRKLLLRAQTGLALIILAQVAPLLLQAQSSKWWRKVEGFEGTFTTHRKVTGSGGSNQLTSSHSIFTEASGRILLNRWDSNRQAWTGTVTGTFRVDNTLMRDDKACRNDVTIVANGPLIRPPDSSPLEALLFFEDDGTYYFQINYASSPATETTVGVCVFGSGTEVRTVTETWYPEFYHYGTHQPIPSQPGRLNFSGRVDDLGDVGWGILFDGPNLADSFPFDVTWNIQPIGMPEEVEVLISDNFEQFRPTAATGGGLGGQVTLNARLHAKTGELKEKATQFRWQFAHVSREPGYALNAPLLQPGTDPDLRFEPDGNVVVNSGDGLSAETPPGEYTESSAVAGSYDWGGFGRFTVTAVMEDGREIRGYLETDPAQTEVRLPKRADGDLIAKVWRDQSGVGSLSDSSDQEDVPAGDGNNGDGLTLYEEYRGFIENGRHIEGDPKRKDYFALNRAGGVVAAGLRTFETLTGLKVHGRLQPSELPANRVINSNHAATPHQVDQHAVILEADSSVQGYAQAFGGPGTPGLITKVVLPMLTGAEAADEIQYLGDSMVHELLHTVNVYHHGEALEQSVTWSGNATNGYFETANGTKKPIRIQYENGAPYTRDLGAGRPILLGPYGSPYSGVDTCIMRYDAAKGYPSQTDPDLRYRSDEIPGHQLCNTTAGTGVNDPGHQPQSRFGPAAPNRGNCAGQILVNDAVQAPVR
ncbi:hypothetical protein [Paludibaculum fermentans]|uniref:hypothetical protein n=1 Tax=Paludibaculum fermentans TaxID=1473598 RepID=UPI003EBDB404